MKDFLTILILLTFFGVACGEDEEPSSNNGGVTNNGGGGNDAGTPDLADTVTQCNPEFGEGEACGGDPIGSWRVGEACTNFDYEGTLRQFCPGAMVRDVEENLAGTLEIDQSTFTQQSAGTVTVSADIPATCAAVVGGCPGVQTAAANIASSVECQVNGEGGCDCDFHFDAMDSSADSYTIEDGVITLESGETWYFCVENDEMTLRQFGSAVAVENVVYVLGE